MWGGFLLSLIDFGKDLQRGQTQRFDDPINHRPVALLQSMEESRIRSEQDEPIASIRSNFQWQKPGRELIGVELLLELLADEPPQLSRRPRFGRRSCLGLRRLGFGLIGDLRKGLSLEWE